MPCNITTGCHMSPAIGLFKGPRGSIRKCHVAPPGDATWHHPGSAMCLTVMTACDIEYPGGPMRRCHVTQSVGDTWHPRFSQGQLVSENSKWIMVGPRQIWQRSAISSDYCKCRNSLAKFSRSYNHTPKWEPMGFDPETSP
jgi:hypothetical protein